MTTCLDCGSPSNGVRCGACWRAMRKEPPIGRYSAPLPAREPTPHSWVWCRCGSLRHLFLVGDEWKCRDCMGEGEDAA